MNLNHTVKVVGSVVLSAVMAGSMMPVTVFAQSNDENPTEKTETVYSVLNSDGSISDTIVSSWLHDEDGINNIKEQFVYIYENKSHKVCDYSAAAIVVVICHGQQYVTKTIDRFIIYLWFKIFPNEKKVVVVCNKSAVCS